MSALVLLVGAVVPSILLLWYLVSRDANPEPRGVLVRTFFLGVLVTVPVVPLAMLLEWAGAWFPGPFGAAFNQGVLGAAIPEELFKFAVLRWYVWRHPAFDERMDGLVYGATASLGFATLENLLYVGGGGTGVAILRAFTAVPGHASWGVIMGAYLGRARFAPLAQRLGLLVRGVVAAIVLHGAYDFLLFTGTAWALLAPVVLIYGVVWALRLVPVERAEQVRVAAASVEVTPGSVEVSVMVATVTAEPPPGRSAWGILKLVFGALGLTTAVAFDGLFLLALADQTIAPDLRAALVVLAILTFLVGVGFFFLFRSGLRLRPR
jgi:RsiW-degrading membrane proteinase PrsW (M82 family)